MCKVNAKTTCSKGGGGGVMGIKISQRRAMSKPIPINLVLKGLIKIVMFFLIFFLQYPTGTCQASQGKNGIKHFEKRNVHL
jgi:hypothetical protein